MKFIGLPGVVLLLRYRIFGEESCGNESFESLDYFKNISSESFLTFFRFGIFSVCFFLEHYMYQQQLPQDELIRT